MFTIIWWLLKMHRKDCDHKSASFWLKFTERTQWRVKQVTRTCREKNHTRDQQLKVTFDGRLDSVFRSTLVMASVWLGNLEQECIIFHVQFSPLSFYQEIIISWRSKATLNHPTLPLHDRDYRTRFTVSSTIDAQSGPFFHWDHWFRLTDPSRLIWGLVIGVNLIEQVSLACLQFMCSRATCESFPSRFLAMQV